MQIILNELEAAHVAEALEAYIDAVRSVPKYSDDPTELAEAEVIIEEASRLLDRINVELKR